jgi:hypothetical protein
MPGSLRYGESVVATGLESVRSNSFVRRAAINYSRSSLTGNRGLSKFALAQDWLLQVITGHHWTRIKAGKSPAG